MCFQECGDWSLENKNISVKIKTKHNKRDN